MPIYQINTDANPAYLSIPGGGNGSFTLVEKTADYTANFGELVDGDPTGASFNVQLPAASAAVATNNAVAVANNSSGPNTVTVVLGAGDTICGVSGSLVLSAQQSVYLVADGTSNWVIVSRSPYGYVVANLFPGGDIGAKINSACAAIPGGGTVVVLDADYTVTTKIVIEAGITLRLGIGTYSNAFAASYTAPWLLKDNSHLIGSGWGTKIMEVIAGFTSVTIADYNSGIAGDNSVAGNQNISVSNLQVIGNPATTFQPESAGIQFGNIRNCTVDNCYFNGCAGYGVFQASSAVSGHHGDGFVIKNCLFENITLQHCGTINCFNFEIRDNLFRPTTSTHNYTVIDCESNTGADILRNFEIIDNTFDMSNNAILNPGSLIQVVGGQNIPYTLAGRAADGTISGNVCIGGSAATEFNWFAQGINLLDCDYVTVSDNEIHYCRVAITLAYCNSCTVADNTTGTNDFTEAWHILLRNSFDNVIRDNKCVENFAPHRSTPILAEDGAAGTCDYNVFDGNWLSFYPYVAPDPTTLRYAQIRTIGVNSVVINSVLGQYPTPVDAPLITSITALRALDPPGVRAAGRPAVVALGGYAAQGDGGTSVWIYDPASVAVDNGITVVVPHYRPGTTGAWLRAPQLIPLTTVARTALVLTATDAGFAVQDTTLNEIYTWNGTAWCPCGAYTATTAGDWAASTPANSIGEALDRIAAALNALGHKP